MARPVRRSVVTVEGEEVGLTRGGDPGTLPPDPMGSESLNPETLFSMFSEMEREIGSHPDYGFPQETHFPPRDEGRVMV